MPMTARPTAARRGEVIAPGFKYNLADINAALALVQLGKLKQANKRRRDIAGTTCASWPTRRSSRSLFHHGRMCTRHLFIIRVDEARCGISRDNLMAALKENIGTGLHFRAAHTQNTTASVFLMYRSRILNGTARVFVLSTFPGHDS